MTLEKITWIDTGKMWSGWHSREWLISQAKEWHGRSVTVGYVVYEDENVVLVAQTLDQESDNVAGAFLIHVPSIEDREVVLGV